MGVGRPALEVGPNAVARRISLSAGPSFPRRKILAAEATEPSRFESGISEGTVRNLRNATATFVAVDRTVGLDGKERLSRLVEYKYMSPSKLAKLALEANPDKSNRVIAVDLGVHHSTVARARPPVAFATPEKTVGLDGKSYPARRGGRSKIVGQTLSQRAMTRVGGEGAR
jgi:hypothetical protein